LEDGNPFGLVTVQFFIEVMKPPEAFEKNLSSAV
jgi:hypothetical protein